MTRIGSSCWRAAAPSYCSLTRADTQAGLLAPTTAQGQPRLQREAQRQNHLQAQPSLAMQLGAATFACPHLKASPREGPTRPPARGTPRGLHVLICRVPHAVIGLQRG